MIEFLRHITGLCGEPHLNILTIMFGTPIVGYLLYKIKNKLKS